MYLVDGQDRVVKLDGVPQSSVGAPLPIVLSDEQDFARLRSEERRVGKECISGVSRDFSSRRRHTRSKRDWSSDVCSSDLSSGLHADRAPQLKRYIASLG